MKESKFSSLIYQKSMSEKRLFSINSLFFGEKNTCILTLKESGGEKIVQMVIGYLDAQPIAIELEKISKPRPWMHDLLKNILNEHNVSVTQVEITDVEDNMFFSNILFSSGKVVDARPSDAILIALTCKVPIYVSSELLEKLDDMDFEQQDPDSEEGEDGDTLDQEEEPSSKKQFSPPNQISELERYKSLLTQAIANEDYEMASKYRDRIKFLEEEN